MFSISSNENKINHTNVVAETERNEAVRSGTERYLTLSNPDEVTGAYSYSAICNLNYLGDLASISITVYFDDTVVRQVNGASNYAACYTYDLTYDSNSVTYTALFTGSKESGTSLFYFSFGMRVDAPACQSYFDVVVNEAYDSSLNEIEVAGIRKYYTVNAYDPNASYGSITFRGYAPSSTKMNEEFDILYTASSANIASGSLNIYYDNEFFEPVSFTPREFLNNKIVDYNLDIPGTVYVSFISTEYSNSTTMFALRFRTIKNQNAYKRFEFATSDLYDLYFNALTFKSTDAYISVIYDASLDENRPTMKVESALGNDQITLTANLSAGSHLGAGDFVIEWDKDYLEFVSYQKQFTPSFFNVNTKELTNNKIKFSIISLTDIVDSTDVLSIAFNVLWHHDDEDINFVITGSGLTDSLTNSISLNFVNCSQVSLGTHNFGEWNTVQSSTCTENGLEHRVCTICNYEETRIVEAVGHTPNEAVLENNISPTCTENGGYDLVVYCANCDAELSREHIVVPATGHLYSEEWTIDIESTCEHEGQKSHHCENCDAKIDITPISKLYHIPSEAVVENNVLPTCTEDGSYDSVIYCGVCGKEISRNHIVVEATGHTFGEWFVSIEPTYEQEGLEHRVCSVCGYEETRAIPVVPDNPYHYLESASSYATLHGTETIEENVLTVSSVYIRFGGAISVSDWGSINSKWEISDYGVMLVKKTTLENTYKLSSVEEAYRAGKPVANGHKGSGIPPVSDDDIYSFNVKLNVIDYDIVFCAAPYVVANGEYYFLEEMEFSVNILSQRYLTNGGSELSNDALSILAGN